MPNRSDQQQPAPVDWVRIKRLFAFNACAVLILIACGYFFRSLLAALFISLFLSYLTAPVVAFLQRKVRLPRVYLVLFMLVTLLSVIGAAMTLLVPVVYRQSIGILAQIPRAVDYISQRVDPVKRYLADSGFVAIERVDAFFKDFDFWENVARQTRTAVQGLLQTTPDVLSGMLNTVLIPVLVFFMLADLPLVKRMAASIVPEDLKEPMQGLQHKLDVTLKTVLKGQVIVAGILAVLYMAGLSLIQLETGLAIGLIAGVCRIIPYLDVIVGISLSLVIVITTGAGFTKLLMVGVVFMVVQVVDGMFITPRVIGERAGLHPGVVIVSVIAFGDKFGFWGVLMAIPVVAIIRVLLQSGVPIYRASPLYRREL